MCNAMLKKQMSTSVILIFFCVISTYPARIFEQNKDWNKQLLNNGNFYFTVTCRLLYYANILYALYSVDH